MNSDRLVQPFPRPGRAVQAAFDQLEELGRFQALNLRIQGDPASFPRPWDPATITNTDMRMQLWTWLSQVVEWVNAEYAWEVDDMIPACWPRHPALVHEIGTLADQRRLAGLAATSDTLTRWHETTLPNFWLRMRTQTRGQCQERHGAWPARARHQRNLSMPAWQERNGILLQDLQAEPGRRPTR